MMQEHIHYYVKCILGPVAVMKCDIYSAYIAFQQHMCFCLEYLCDEVEDLPEGFFLLYVPAEG